VQRTAELYQRFVAELDGLNLTITRRAGPCPRSTVDGPKCRIRRTEVAVSLEDSRPCTGRCSRCLAVDYVIAERVDTAEATHDVQALLDITTLDQLFDPVIRWRAQGSVSTQELVTA
jgi:hypothetical protein